MNSHPCGYVNIIDYKDILAKPDNFTPYSTERYDWIECHGGITNADYGLADFQGGYWIGWDYAHLGDKYHNGIELEFGNEYDTDEVATECRRVIDQIETYMEGFKNGVKE